MTLHTQWLTMGVMILCGLYIGITTDTLRRLLLNWKIPGLLSLLGKILYWMIQTVILYFILYVTNGGLLRLYLLLACLLGFSIYMALIRRIYLLVLEFFIRCTKTIAATIYQVLLQPLWLAVNLLLTRILALIVFCLKLLFHILKILMRPFILVLHFIYRLLPGKFHENITKSREVCSTIGNIIILQWKRWIKRG